jgi:hypothetical protein
MRDQLWKLPQDGNVMFAECAHQQPIPRLLSRRHGQIKTVVEMCRIEAEQLPCKKSRVIFERLKDPQQWVSCFDFPLTSSDRLPPR